MRSWLKLASFCLFSVACWAPLLPWSRAGPLGNVGDEHMHKIRKKECDLESGDLAWTLACSLFLKLWVGHLSPGSVFFSVNWASWASFIVFRLLGGLSENTSKHPAKPLAHRRPPQIRDAVP